MMFELRVTGPDGSSRSVPLGSAPLTVGRAAENLLVLDGSAVSSYHCQFELLGAEVVLRERGSRNGTWVNGLRIPDAVRVTESDRIYVGSYLVEVVRASPSRMGAVPEPRVLPPTGPILRQPSHLRAWRDLHGRYDRFASEWDARHRPPHLALRSAALREARTWLAAATPEMRPPVNALQREFIAASERLARKRAVLRGVGIAAALLLLGGAIAGALYAWPRISAAFARPVAEAVEPGGGTGGEEAGGYLQDADIDETPPVSAGEVDEDCGVFDPDDPDRACVDVNEPIKHRVIPFETLEDIARRYDVSIDALADWNLINPDAPIEEGTVLTIRDPRKRPLPQTRITYQVEPGETWTKLAERFGVPAKRLQAYNPGLDKLTPETEIAVWIDPKPYEPRAPRPIPTFHIDKQAVSVGEPNAGRLENGIQMPESDLYTRRNPHIMWGSALTISSLQEAVAHFRQDVDFDGVVILADISKKGGGLFPPHKSHQAGRDIDIWLPTLKGVYKTKYLGEGKSRPRKPHFEEVDWYATWGLVRALIRTGNVQYVFLDWRYQKFVYDAAVNMGATQGELDEWIQYPRHKSSPRGIFRHSTDHLSHIHVRFKCAEWEPECSGARADAQE